MKEYERIWKWSIWHCHPCWDAIVSQGLRKMQIKFPEGTRKNEVGQYISLSPCLGLIGQQFEQTSSVQSGHRHICTVCHFIKGKNLANIKTPTQWLRQSGNMEGHRVPLALHLKHCEKRCNRNRARQEPWGHTLFISQLWLKMQLKQPIAKRASASFKTKFSASSHGRALSSGARWPYDRLLVGGIPWWIPPSRKLWGREVVSTCQSTFTMLHCFTASPPRVRGKFY